MNRATVVFLALAILLAHTLALHQTPEGLFATAYDQAHVAYRLGRNLVHEGRALWDPLGPWIESHPSPLLIGVAALAAQLNVFPTTFAQGLGIFCALATIGVVAQFSPKRVAGLIAPLLLATSGTVAAAAASGTEAALTMLLLSTSFLAFERGWTWGAVASGVLLVLARPECGLLLVGMGLMEVLDRPRNRWEKRRPPMRLAFGVLAGFVLTLVLLRQQITGHWISPLMAETLAFDTDRQALGAHYVFSFLYGSGTGVLLLLPLVMALTGRLEPTGRRALILFLGWALLVAASGGDMNPFWNALAPAAPLLFLAVQGSITRWLDARPGQAWFAWPLLAVPVAASLFASKLPGDVGPLPMDRLVRAWERPTLRLGAAFERPLASRGLLWSTREVERLRTVGAFLRDEASADATIGTFWPGAIGYLSRKEVHDLLGRTDPLPGEARTRSWRGVPRIDLVGALERRMDYLVILIEEPPPGVEILRRWLRRYDVVGDAEERLRELLHALRHYELVSVPVADESGSIVASRSSRSFLLLRNKELELTPRTEIERDGRSFAVLVRHQGHGQVVDVWVSVTDEEGDRWQLRPTGEWTRSNADARTDLLVHDTGPRAIHMVRARLPNDFVAAELTVRLHNPGLPLNSPLAPVGSPVTIRLR